MNAILDVPSIRERVSRVTVEQYQMMPERNANGRRTELIRGIVLEKMPKSPLHGTIASRLLQMILPQLPADVCARQEQPLSLHDSEPEPDVSVMDGHLDDYLEAHPTTALLVVEIFISTRAEDQLKAFIYAEANVTEYWIVLPKLKTIEVYRRPGGGRYSETRVFRAGEELVCTSKAGVRIVLDRLFAGVLADPPEAG